MKHYPQIFCALFLALFNSACENQVQKDEAKIKNTEKDSAHYFFQQVENEVENCIFSVNGKLTFETEKGKGLKIRILIPA